ncbi:uncharacterized protein [Polyergus mexicanus]|uniref:uncharacterized protein n=1 Tax=Polyergus mexicanus TaxID=615972 RepID=UPI0038B654DB
MSELLASQAALQRSIERALENFKKIGRNNLTAAKVRTRISALKELWRPFREGHVIMTRTIPVSDQITMDYFTKATFDKTEEVYNTTWEHMVECLEELEPPLSPNQSIMSGHSNPDASALSLSHLPPIRLPPFDGNYAEWENFRDRFTALIINNKDVSDFARMHFLASSLKGRALETIGNIAITATNFPIAWHALTARFENKRRLLTSHLSTLLGLSAVSKESASDLQFLCDKANIAIASLQNLDRTPSNLWNDILVHLLSQKLDAATRKAWTLHTHHVDTPPTYEDLNKFLFSRIRALEECAFNSTAKPASKSATSSRVNVATASTVALAACPLCKARHYLNACPEFIGKNATQRRETVKRFKRCFNCLSARHSAQECKSKYTCRSCDKRHHTMLHAESDSSSGSYTLTPQLSPSATISADTVNSLSASTKPGVRPPVLLATALVRVKVASGRSATVRALIDQGSEASIISENLAQLLRAKRIRMPTAIAALGGTPVATLRHAAAIVVSSRDSDAPSVSTTALIMATLTAYRPKRVSDYAAYPHLTNLKWADADPTSSDPIQLILGSDVYHDVLLDGRRKGKLGQLAAQESIFGWVISGPLTANAQTSRFPAGNGSTICSTSHITVHHCTSINTLAKDIQKFWEIEELPQSHILTPQDEQCEAHFRDTHSRDADGRYIVRLPFKRGPPIDIGRSRLTAERLFKSLTRRFRSNADLQMEYSNFMSEYETLGHMRRASINHESSDQRVYIPHHPVFRDGSSTTHLRVVFNASSVSSNGSSLNDHLFAGPKLQTELPAIILQWRHFKYVYAADIAKMYRQILIDPRDVHYQCVLWKGDSEDPIDYQLLTVTYGMTCAPYLALRVLRSLIDDDGHRFPLATPILRDQIYVDDVLFGGDDPTLVRQSRDQLVALLQCGKFTLRKWVSNSSSMLEDIDPSDHGLAFEKPIATDDKLKVLGIVWNPTRDVFQFKVSLNDSLPWSKRAILSTIAKLYDPLGWVTPVTVSAKIFMQQLWRRKLLWDDVIPEPLLGKWQSIHSKLSHLNDLQIDRWTGVQSDVAHIELHGFADASTLAYAAAVYLKVVSGSGNIVVTLLAGKSRVAPIAPLTVPRLELSAALLLVRLIDFVRRSFKSKPLPCVCWTDSTIVLTWLRSHPSRWKTFVANRVTEIQSRLPDTDWRHVPTSDNPADCASRGLVGDELINHAIWWHGPSWLKHPKEDWPPEPVSHPVPHNVEEKVIALNVSELPTHWDLASRYSSWPKLLRVTAYLFKFIYACRHCKVDSRANAQPSKAINSVYVGLATTFWIKRIQINLFSDEINQLTKRQRVASRSPIVSLLPFLDADGILRVGGRLRHAPLPYRVKHPILLASHPLVQLIVLQAHTRALHGGSQLTLSILRQAYWILRARSMVKAVIHRCIVCVRERAAVPTQLMGDLPAMRVSPPPRCFSHCGLDYAGPVRVRASAGRGVVSRKAYIALFVCLATRAIHLELVVDYSTAAFLNAYLRFCSRRGLPHSMYSDNGTSFVGADKELQIAYQSAIRDPNFLNKTACDNVTWNFIPPSAPHFGGMWEAGVRSVKHHLRRVLGEHTLTFEEFTTLLCKIEACLNSRPLAPLSDSLDEFDSLTPGHFLIGQALTVPPEPSLVSLTENRLSRWQLIRHVSERFWKIWACDYVNTLQQRHKWQKVQPAVKLGQLVLLRNTNLPPCKWELGRITQLHPGSDSLTRVVTVKTATSEFRRPIVKLCALPVDSVAPN